MLISLISRLSSGKSGQHQRAEDFLQELRLTRGLDNRLALVTTNFDTLFERALAQQVDVDSARAQGSRIKPFQRREARTSEVSSRGL